uniref:Uncharacterized protein n=1 Tax=Picea sitchensis TaxID=3332 RepID=A0A6B9XTD7_PICSI|nr:hypothetical protein Q903MT_gene4321 [Picea sitchensis]
MISISHLGPNRGYSPQIPPLSDLSAISSNRTRDNRARNDQSNRPFPSSYYALPPA